MPTRSDRLPLAGNRHGRRRGRRGYPACPGYCAGPSIDAVGRQPITTGEYGRIVWSALRRRTVGNTNAFACDPFGVFSGLNRNAAVRRSENAKIP